MGVSLVGRVLLAQHLALRNIWHCVATTEAYFDWGIGINFHIVVVACRRYAVHVSLHLRLNVRVV